MRAPAPPVIEANYLSSERTGDIPLPCMPVAYFAPPHRVVSPVFSIMCPDPGVYRWSHCIRCSFQCPKMPGLDHRPRHRPLCGILNFALSRTRQGKKRSSRIYYLFSECIPPLFQERWQSSPPVPSHSTAESWWGVNEKYGLHLTPISVPSVASIFLSLYLHLVPPNRRSGQFSQIIAIAQSPSAMKYGA